MPFNINESHLNEQQRTQQKTNAGKLTMLPNEVFIHELARKHLASDDIAVLRQSCRFFASNRELKKTMAEKNLKLIPTAYGTFLLYKGRAFRMGTLSSGSSKKDHSGISSSLLSIPMDKPIVRIICGNAHAFLFDCEGTCYGIGDNQFGQLNQNQTSTVIYEPKLVQLNNKQPIVDVVPGTNHTFLRDAQNNWFGVGHWNGRNYTIWEPRLIQLPKGTPIAKIITRDNHTFLQDVKGNWYGWGNGRCVGLGTYCFAPTLLDFGLPGAITNIEVGEYTSFFREQSGQWYVCGSNLHHQLGISNTLNSVDYQKPTALNLLNGKRISKIVCGKKHTFICDHEGQWYGCGNNEDGQLGLGNAHTITTPTPIYLPNENKICDVVTKDLHTFFQDQYSQWYYCGSNKYGALANVEGKQVVPAPFDFAKLEAEIEKIDALEAPRLR